MSSKHRSFRMEREKLFLGEEVDADEKLDVYQLQNLFQGYGYSFPIISVIAIFTWAAQQEKGTCEEKLSLKQIDMLFQRDLKHIDRTEGIPSYFPRMKNSMKTYFDVLRLMFRLGYNWFFIDTILFVIAGLLLTVAVLIPESSLAYYPHRANMNLLAAFSYIFCTGRFVVMFPFRDFRARVNSEKRVDGLKLDLLHRAHIHKDEKKAIDISLRESDFVVGESNTSIADILSYIEEVLYSNDVNLQMTKLDLEMLVFRYLKQNYAERVTEDILTVIDVSRDRKIGVEEMHRFLCSNGNASTNSFRWLHHAHSSLKASNGFDLKWLYGDKNPSYYSGWLNMIGCTFFVLNAYRSIQTSYEREVNAKEVLKNCIDYGALQKSGTYHRSSRKLLEISKNDGNFQRKDLRDLFMSSGIMMQEKDVDAIFDTIDSDRSGNITKDEIDAFLSADESRDIEILKRCFHDFYFWAQFAWFIGAFGYLIPAYGGVRYLKAYFIVGGIGNLIGGLGSLGTLYQTIQNTKKTLIQMKMCVSNMVNGRIDIQLISPHMHRFKDDIFKASGHEYDEKSFTTQSKHVTEDISTTLSSSMNITPKYFQRLAVLCGKQSSGFADFVRRHRNTFQHFHIVGDITTKEIFRREGLVIPESFQLSDIDRDCISGLIVFGEDNDEIDVNEERLKLDTVIKKTQAKDILLATNKSTADMFLAMASIHHVLEESNTNLTSSFYVQKEVNYDIEEGQGLIHSESFRTITSRRETMRNQWIESSRRHSEQGIGSNARDRMRKLEQGFYRSSSM